MSRIAACCRLLLIIGAGFFRLVASPVVQASDTSAFGYEVVVAKAQEISRQPYAAPAPVPGFLGTLSYDAYRDIRFRPDKSLWRRPGNNFDLHFIHPGSLFNRAVVVNLVTDEGVSQFPFSKELFDYGSNQFDEEIPQDLGYAGFVLNFPLKRPDLQSQVLVFAGASYFRALGQDSVFGLSARGLAIDTGLPHGEEFPIFREFWLVKPAPEAQTMTIYALLDSERLAGAYEFVVRPGETTVMKVRATLFERERVEELGIAPLTSMFLHGEGSPRPAREWRPEVHDSDGLLVITSTGERIWRPLVNSGRLRLSTFLVDQVRGFGLLQRDRRFCHYEDLETHQELRPNAWVVPIGDWGPGRVKLTEIPTDSEANDNIVAYWIPDHRPEPGQPYSFAYELHWGFEDPAAFESGIVTATRIGSGPEEGSVRLLVDFEGEELSALPEDEPPEAVITLSEGARLIDKQIARNPVTGGWRLVFQVEPPKDRSLELRAFLRKDGSALTETWSYLFEH